MTKFQFRLEKLKKVRQLDRNQRLASLTESFRAQEILEERLKQLQQELEDLRRDQRAAMTETHLDVNRLMAAGRHEPVIKAQYETTEQQIELVAQEVQRRREALVASTRNVRALELLEERQREKHRQEQLRAEAKQLDEVANTRSRPRQQED